MDFFERLNSLSSYLDDELHQIESSLFILTSSGRRYDEAADISIDIQDQIKDLQGQVDDLIKEGNHQVEHMEGFMKGMVETLGEFDDKIQRIEDHGAKYGFELNTKEKSDLRESLKQVEVSLDLVRFDCMS